MNSISNHTFLFDWFHTRGFSTCQVTYPTKYVFTARSGDKVTLKLDTGRLECWFNTSRLPLNPEPKLVDISGEFCLDMIVTAWLKSTLREIEAYEASISSDAVVVKTISIVRRKLGLDASKAIGTNMHLVDDLGADSLDEIEIIMEVEDTFNIQIEDNEIRGIRDGAKTIQNLVEMIKGKMKQ